MWRNTKGLPSGFSAKFADKELFFYLCPVRSCRILTHGVMATLQILVLSFQVRVLVGQLRERKFPRRNFRSRRFRSRPSGANRAAVGLRISSSVRRKDHGCCCGRSSYGWRAVVDFMRLRYRGRRIVFVSDRFAGVPLRKGKVGRQSYVSMYRGCRSRFSDRSAAIGCHGLHFRVGPLLLRV